MKKIGFAVGALVAALAGAGAASANFGPGCHPEDMEVGRHLEKMGRVLKLTDTQKAKIREICDVEKEKIKPLADKMQENQKLLKAAGEGTSFDEMAVRAIASAQAQLHTEMCVSRIKVHTQINALLTPEQLELAKNLRPEMGAGSGHRGGHGGCQGCR